MVAIPTTSGTGSEVTPFSFYTDDTTDDAGNVKVYASTYTAEGEKYNLSARMYFKILKVARTLADLDNNENAIVSSNSRNSEIYAWDRNGEAKLHRF